MSRRTEHGTRLCRRHHNARKQGGPRLYPCPQASSTHTGPPTHLIGQGVLAPRYSYVPGSTLVKTRPVYYYVRSNLAEERGPVVGFGGWRARRGTHPPYNRVRPDDDPRGLRAALTHRDRPPAAVPSRGPVIHLAWPRLDRVAGPQP